MIVAAYVALLTANTFAAVASGGISAAVAERTVWFEDDCEGKPQIGFVDISEPTVRGRAAALATGKIAIDREGYTDISEMRSHAGVHAFVIDTTLDGLSGKWGGRASWGSTTPLAVPADRSVYLTAFVRTEVLSPEISVEMAVLFDGADGKGNAVNGGCLQFKPEGQDPNGWLVFSRDVAALVRKHGFRADRITGWRLVLNGPGGRPLRKARTLLYVDDISFASEPPKMPALSKPGEEAKYQKIEPGPHAVGYMSLYDRFPDASHNRTWNSSFENGFDRWSGGISPLDEDLHIADSAKAVKIVRGDSPHGDCHVEMGDPEGRVSSVGVSTLPFPIKEGRRYTLSFYAKASQPGAVLTAEGRGVRGGFALTDAWRRYSLDIPKMVCFNYGPGRQYPGRWKFSLGHRGAAKISLDAVQVEEGPLTDFAYPPIVSVAVHSHHRYGILGAKDSPEAYVTVFNGFDVATNAVVETEIRNFRHDSVRTARQTLALGPRERREIPISFAGAESLRHWKLTAKVRVDGVVEQEARGAICRVDDVAELPGADYFGQLGYAGTNVGNFDQVLELNRLLGVKRMLVYNNLRRDWESGWQTNALYDARRDLYVDAVLKAGFIPELAIYPFARELKLEKGTDAHILTDEAIADVDAWVRRFATHLRGRVGHYEVFGEYMRGETTRRAQNVATLLEVVSKALRDCSPGCEITAFAEDNMPNICGELEPHFKLGSLRFCDNVSLHPYCVGNENQELLDDAEPAVRRLIDRYASEGRKIPFSCGEAGHRAVDTLYWDETEPESMYYPIHCTELEQAERTVREIVIGMTHGFSRYIAFYTTSGGTFFSFNYVQYGDGDGFRPKTVFPAFNNLVRRLAGFTLVKSFADRDRKLRGAAFTRGGRAIAVVWHYPDDHKPTNARLAFDPNRLTGCNVVGEEFVPNGKGGVTEFVLDGSPVFFETDVAAADELAAALAAIDIDYKGRDTGRVPLARIVKAEGNPFADRLGWPKTELGGKFRVSRGVDPTPYGGTNDLSAVVRGASDGERLYLDIEVTDDIRATPYDAAHGKRLIWSNDALQMAFDRADGSGLKEINFSAPPAGEVFFTIANDPIREDGIRFKARTEGTVTEYRIVIPWKALWNDFAAGDETRVKFCLAVVDNDGERGNPKLRTYGDRQALQLAPGLYLGGKQSSDYPKFAFEK